MSEFRIDGGIKTHGAGVAPFEQYGTVESLRVFGGVVAARSADAETAAKGEGVARP